MNTLSRLLSVACLFATVVAAHASEPFALQPGTHYLRVVVNVDGSFAVSPITPIVIAANETPTPPPIKPDPTLTERGKLIRQAALAVNEPKRDETATTLAATYREIANQITAGKIKGHANISFALKTAADLILIQQRATSEWQPVRAVLGSQVTTLVQDGAPDNAYAQLLGEVADALDSIVTKQQAINLEMILKLIELILELIARLNP